MKMKKRISYTLSRKNPILWLAVLLALAAAVGYIANVTCGKGAGVSGTRIWLRCVLPAAAALYFCYQMPVNGPMRSYRAAVPFWILLIGWIYEACTLGLAWYWVVLLVLAMLALTVWVHKTLSGTVGTDWAVILAAGLFMAFTVRANAEIIRGGFNFRAWMPFLPDLAFLLAYIVLAFALKKVDDGKYHPTWGDRFDGRRIRSLSPISTVGTYIMPERNQANVFFQDKLEITELEKYVRRKRAEGMEHFGMTEVLLAAYVRTVSKYPAANRFISGEKIFTRVDDMQFCMTVKKEMTKESPDTVIKVHLKPGDGVQEVYEKFQAVLSDVKKSMELDSGFDGIAALFNLIPGVLLKFAIWLLKLLDYFGLLPRVILELSPFHGSIFFTSMGSLGIQPVFHHLYNFGNLPIFLAFGRKYRVNETQDDGTVVSKKYMDYTFNVDERIVDGFYYATVIKHFHKLLLHPERLDDPEIEVNEDIP